MYDPPRIRLENGEKARRTEPLRGAGRAGDAGVVTAVDGSGAAIPPGIFAGPENQVSNSERMPIYMHLYGYICCIYVDVCIAYGDILLFLCERACA